MPEPTQKRQLTSTVYATPLMTPTKDLGLSIRLSMFELHETGDRDIFLGPLERARAETGGADQWVSGGNSQGLPFSHFVAWGSRQTEVALAMSYATQMNDSSHTRSRHVTLMPASCHTGLSVVGIPALRTKQTIDRDRAFCI